MRTLKVRGALSSPNLHSRALLSRRPVLEIEGELWTPTRNDWTERDLVLMRPDETYLQIQEADYEGNPEEAAPGAMVAIASLRVSDLARSLGIRSALTEGLDWKIVPDSRVHFSFIMSQKEIVQLSRLLFRESSKIFWKSYFEDHDLRTTDAYDLCMLLPLAETRQRYLLKASYHWLLHEKEMTENSLAQARGAGAEITLLDVQNFCRWHAEPRPARSAPARRLSLAHFPATPDSASFEDFFERYKRVLEDDMLPFNDATPSRRSRQ